MSKASQSIIIIASLILLVGAGGCGLKLVTQPGATGTGGSDQSPTNNTVVQQIGGRAVAEKWIADSALTYKFDGENLQFMQSVSAKCADAMLYEFTFDSRNGGYGNRVNEALDGIKVTHTIRVTVQQDKVISAVTDDKYNEVTGQFGALPEDTAVQEKCL
jgi:hypothetical protein